MPEELQPDNPQKKRQQIHFPNWARPSIIIITICFFAAGAITWIWRIWGDWSGMMSAVFTITGTISAFLAIPFIQSVGAPKTSTKISDTSQTPHININVSPNINVSTLQPTSQQSSTVESKAPISENTLRYSDSENSPLEKDRFVNTDREAREEIMPDEYKSIFQFNKTLTDPDEFFGRIRERMTLKNRTRIGASTSIVGLRRIGKTWLMKYLVLVAPTELGARFRIGYLDATSASCKTIEAFTAKVLEEWGISTSDIDQTNLGLTTIERAIKDLKSRNRVPVICIDEFENFSNRQIFDLAFFSGLRAMTQTGLSLVVASKTPLIDFLGDYGKTSGFFNIFEQLILKPFSSQEAEKFVQTKGEQAGLTDDEKRYLLHYGQEKGNYWPIRLQLAGKMLLEDKILATKEEDPGYYRPTDLMYWQEYEQRLEEKYRGVVKT